MSTVTLPATRQRDPAEPQHLAGTGTLVRFALRRDSLRLTLWVLGIGGITVYSAAALGTVYPTAADRQVRAEVVTSPAAVMFSGPGFGTDDYTLGAMIANELGLTVMIAAAIMSILLVVRHTRAEEQTGRAELVRAGVVSRHAPLTVALLVTGLANTVVAVVVTAGLVGAGLAAVDALALAVGIALVGLVFGAVAAVTAQITEHARAASGAALALLATAAVVRGIGDVLREGGSALSWFSPIAWAQQSRAFVDLRWWPLLLPVALTAALVVAAFRLVGRRDTGAGLWAPRGGPAQASRLLSGATSLTARLQRATVVAWAVALLLFGSTFGSLTDAVADMVAGNARLAAVFAARGGSLTDSYSASTALYLALAVAAFAVGSVLRLRGEEAAGRTELLLATALDRRRLLGGGLTVTVAASALLLVAAGLGTGLAAAAVSGDAGLVGRLLGAALVPLPAVLVVAGVAAALVGIAPRLSALAWVVVGWALFAGLFGDLLGLPGWATKLSPFGWLPRVPAETLDPVPLTALTVLAATLSTIALTGFRRRDVSG